MQANDLRKIEETFESWWNRSLGRPLVQIFSPRKATAVLPDSTGPFLRPELGWAFLRRYPDASRALDEIFEGVGEIVFQKEAYPNIFVNLGAGILSACLGAELKFDANVGTAWFQGSSSLDELKRTELDRENKWWKYTIECTEMTTKRCQEEACVAFPDLLDPVTVVGLLRGNFPTNLLRDMFTNGNELHEALAKIHDIWFRCFEELCKIMKVSQNGYSTWAGLWSKTKHFVVQGDLIVYLSPKLFDEFVYPLVVEECNYFDRTIWHLDGLLSLNHLDGLLSIDELDAIQWIPRPSDPDCGDNQWLPMYNKILAKGKLLQIFVPPQKVMSLLSKISSQAIAINTVCRTSEEAEKLIQAFDSRYG